MVALRSVQCSTFTLEHMKRKRVLFMKAFPFDAPQACERAPLLQHGCGGNVMSFCLFASELFVCYGISMQSCARPLRSFYATNALNDSDHFMLQMQQPLQARQSAWAAMSTGGRTQFTWPQPGLPRTAHDDEFKKPAPGAEEAALDTFCLVVLIPSYVDYVQLFDNRREVLTRDDTGCGWGPSGWVSVNP
eukprot:319010-Chlamydomonas_euryale.AAC.6